MPNDQSIAPPQSVADAPKLISVIMPAYNAERFIGEAIESVLMQTYLHWELIIVDDGSSDSTIAQVKRYKDARIRLIRSEHIGYLGAVRNLGLKAAEGDFIAFMDSDDCYEPDALELLLDYLLNTPSCTAVYGFSKLIDDKGDFISNKAYPGQPDKENNANTVVLDNYQHTWRAILACDVPNAVQGLMMRRETFKRVGLQTERFNFVPDYLYYIWLFKDDFEGVHYIDRFIFRYRIYASSNTHNQHRFLEALKQIPQYCDWLFSKDGIPAEYHYLKSEITAISYAHLTRSRLGVRNLAQLSRCIYAALFNKNVKFKHWLLYCFPYWIRYFSPPVLDSCLRTVWVQYKASVLYGSKFGKHNTVMLSGNS